MYSNLVHFTSEDRDKELNTVACEICDTLSKKNINIHEALWLLEKAKVNIKFAKVDKFIFPSSSNTD